jgi:hypothetical protein
MKQAYEPPALVECGTFRELTHGVVGVVHEVTGYFFR